MPDHPSSRPIQAPRNWLELASVERQKMDYFAAAKERAAEYVAAMTGQSAGVQARRQQLMAVHDERLVLQNIARTAYLGALGAHVERRDASFAPDQVAHRSAEASLAGHVIGQFVTAAQLLTGVTSLRRSGLTTTATPLQQEAERAFRRGLTALRLQQAGHRQDRLRLPAGAVYVPPLPTTVMNVVLQEVPALSIPHRTAMLQQLLPLMPGRS